jgi:sugar lactone lactonase YvrE
MGEISLVVDGLGIPESTHWHDGKVWLCNWGAGEVLAVTAGGEREVIARLAPQTLPFSIDWLPDGRMLAVDGPRRLLLGLEPDGALAAVAELGSLGAGAANELVVDGAGNAYVNGGAGSVVRVTPDGSVDKVAGGLKFPNGMALIDRDCTLIVADSYVQAHCL